MKKTSQVILHEGEFYIIAAPNGKVLEVADYNTENGAAIQLWDYAGQPWQQWQFVEAGDNEYRIQNRFTGKMIDLAFGGVVEGTWLHQWSRTSGASQRWQLEPCRSGRVRIRSVLAGKCIDLVAMNTKNGARAQIWVDVQGGNQEWNLRHVETKDLPQAPAPAKRQTAADGKTPAQRKRQKDLVEKINSHGAKGKRR